MRRLLPLALLALVALLPAGVADAAGMKAKIRLTAHGIPHIEAKSYTGAGFGYGYAFARDNICPIADAYVTVRAERSRFFGPEAGYQQRGNGYGANNLNSDFFYKRIIDSKTIEGLLAKKPPLGPLPGVKQLVRGYVAGYNRYLKDVGGTNGVPDKTCRGKPWVRPISVADAYRRFYQLTLLASQSVAIDGIGSAAPPTSALPGPLPLDNATTARELSQRLPLDTIGSNAVAVGKAGTRDHQHGLLLGNPHFPWLGTERFYQSQIRVPGKMNVQGASLFGVPLILIGHTSTMAWSHTVSTAYRFTPYQLTLVPGSPTTYLYDGQPVEMTHRDVTVQVKQADGSLKPQTRTLYSTRFGPMLTSLVGVPLPWGPTTAFAMRDANADNFRIFNHFFATDRAKTARQVYGILKKYEGIPWVNTIVADKGGNALYADIGSIPHVTNDQAQQCDTALGSATFSLLGLPVLDGSKSQCEWGSDPDSVQPGLFGASSLPHLFRRDYVTNSNNSYWLSNPKQPLEGFARIIGDERTARSLRTRIGLIMTQGQVDHGGFTRAAMQRMVFSDRQYAAELTRDDLVAMCRSFNGSAPTSDGGTVPTGKACDVLAGWDRHEGLKSRGALLFRRFWEHATANPASPAPGPSPWKNAFDPADPVHTPNTLNTDSPQVKTALGDALNDLAAAKIPIDAPLGEHQVATRNGVRIPIHGGPGTDGDFDAINVKWVAGKGVSEPEHGSSYVQVVTWKNGSSCPDARTILTYSQSTNPSSPFYADQTRMFSRKKWVPDLFCQAAVLRGTRSTTTIATGRPTSTVRQTHPQPPRRGNR
jgi:acyl-homoserine-lactone acylase